MKEKFYLSFKDTCLLKAIGILFVIFGHLGYLDGSGAWGVHIFLIVSGYGMYCSFAQNPNQEFWYKRLSAVYLPYLLYQPLCLFILAGIGEKVTIKEFIFSVLGLDFCQLADKTMWYLSYLFGWYFIFWLAIKLWKKSNKLYKPVALVVIASAVMALAGYTNVIWNPGTIAWAYFMSFPFGILLGFCHKHFNLTRRRFACISLGAFIVAMTVVVLRYGKPHYSFEELFYSFCGAMPPFVIVTFFHLGNKPGGGGLQSIGRHSFGMYLCEGIMIRWADSTQYERGVKMVIVLMGSYFISVIMHKWIVLPIRNRIEMIKQDWLVFKNDQGSSSC